MTEKLDVARDQGARAMEELAKLEEKMAEAQREVERLQRALDVSEEGRVEATADACVCTPPTIAVRPSGGGLPS